MPDVRIFLDGDGAFNDLADELEGGALLERVAVLRGGMQSGKASVALLIRTREGRPIMAETSLELYLATAQAIRAAGVDKN